MSEEFDVTFVMGSATRDRPPEQYANKSIANINDIAKGSKYTMD